MKSTLTIIGGGVAGAAAALRACQYNIKTIWITGSKEDSNRSRGKWVVNIDNMIGVHPDIMLSKIKAKYKEQADFLTQDRYHISTQDIIDNVHERIKAYGNFVHVVNDTALKAVKNDDKYLVKTPEGEYESEFLILAQGLMDHQPIIHKKIKDKKMSDIKWIYPFANQEQILYCIRCEGHLTNKKKIAIIGSNETAAQISLMLHERYKSSIALLLNGEEPTINETTKKVLGEYAIDVYAEKIVAIEGKPRELKGFTLENEKNINCNFAMVSMGTYRVYNDLALKLGAQPQEGNSPLIQRRILINHKGETCVENLFCIGDMAVRENEPVMMQVYTCQEYAVRAVDTVDYRSRKELRDKIISSF